MTARHVAMASGGRSGKSPAGLPVGEVEAQGGHAFVGHCLSETLQERVFHSRSGAVCHHQGGERGCPAGCGGRKLRITDRDGDGCFSVWHVSIIAHGSEIAGC